MSVSKLIFAGAAVLALVFWSVPSARAWCDPMDLVCGSVVDSDMCHGHDDISYYNCDDHAWNGRAHVYRVFHDGDSLWISLDWDAAYEDRLHIFLLTDCNQNDCIADDANLIAVDVPAGDYWIIVESKRDNCVPYTLHIYCGDHPLAVKLTSFAAIAGSDGVHLTWTVASEVNNTSFQLEREQPGITDWEFVGSVNGRGTDPSSATYTYVDQSALPSTTYTYRLIAVDANGARESLGSATVNAGSSGEPALASGFELKGNFPNPFNPSTTIRFDVAEQMELSLNLYDVTGRYLATLASRVYDAGQHEVSFDARAYPSGVYFARLSNAQTSQLIKMMLMK